MIRILVIQTILILFLITSSYSQIPGNSILLNGTSDYISCPDNNSIDISNNLTIEAWINPCEVDTFYAIINKNWCNFASSFYFSINKRHLRFVNSNGNCNSVNTYTSDNPVIVPNQWTHVAMIHTLDSIKFYVNGEPIPGTLVEGSYSALDNSTEPLRAGAYRYFNGSYSSYFKGQMDEIRIWNRALSVSEIKQKYNQPLTGNEAGLVIYYDMEGLSSNGQNYVIPNKANSTGSVNDGKTFGTNDTPYFVNNNSYSCFSPQSIIFPPITDKTCNTPPFTVNAVSSSGLDVTISVESGPALSSGNIISLTGQQGIVIVKASQSGNTSYAPATDVIQSFYVSGTCITHLFQNITFDSIADKYCTDTIFTISATATSGLPVTFAIVSGPATIKGNNITLSGENGEVIVRSTQSGNDVYAPAENKYQSFTVSGTCSEIFVYDIITANGDGKNDVFYIENLHYYPENEVYIFNRYGNMVYSKQGYDNDWNGGNLPDGSYFYLIKIQEINKTFRGGLTLSR